MSEWVCGLLDSVRIKFDDVNFIESDLGNDSTLKSIIGNQQISKQSLSIGGESDCLIKKSVDNIEN